VTGKVRPVRLGSPDSRLPIRRVNVISQFAVTLVFVAHSLAAQSPIAPGSIRGTTVDLSGKIVSGVEITVIDLNRSAQTTGGGWYVFDTISPGNHQLRARRVGYETVSLSLQVLSNDVTSADIVMKPLVVQLTPVLVADKIRDTRGAPLEFAQRAATGQGTYFTSADIEKLRPHRVSELLRRVSGIKVLPNGEIFSGRGITTINTRACEHGMPVYVDRILVGGGSEGDPASITDDALGRKADFMSPTSASRSAVDGIKPENIAGIEVYNGPATAPSTISGTTSSCGVILIWTR